MPSPDAMDVEEIPKHQEEKQEKNDEEIEEEQEDVEDLLDWMDMCKVESNDKISILTNVMESPKQGPKATAIKERAVYDLTRAYCQPQGSSTTSTDIHAIVQLLETSPFFGTITKAKCAKVVRQVLDIVCSLAPSEYDLQHELCSKIIDWCVREKRSFLRQRVQSKLASILFYQHEYATALQIIDGLLTELKQLDDKQLLVETHLMESKIHFALRNVPKAKAALTASRTCANAIYVAPKLQASIDTMSGTIHTEEGDYNTAHSYFLEAFEQLDQMNEQQQAISCLKYMMLCRILDALTKALALVSNKSSESDPALQQQESNKKSKPKSSESTVLDVTTLVSARQAVKYAGRELDAMSAIAKAASQRSLNDFQQTLAEYANELQQDFLIKHHLHILQEQLLESNLIRIMEPYSCVELSHIATLMELPLPTVEKKLSQMILDGKFHGILDQGKGQLVVYEESQKDRAMTKGLQVLEHMDEVVTTLFERSKALRTLML